MAVATAAFCVPAFGQTASQITPESFRPAPSPGAGGFVLPGAPGLQAPAGAEKLFVRLKGVRVAGGRGELTVATAELNQRLSRQRISAAEIFAAARELEAAYSRAGYVLARVVLPPQRLVNGAVLQLTVVDGFIERVDTQGVPERVRARIAALTASLVGQRGLMLSEIERRVLLAGDTPGVVLRSTLTPGRAAGATVLVLEVKQQPVVGTFTTDNTLSAGLGRYSFGVGADFNSIAGFGEQFYLRAGGYPDASFTEARPRNRSLAAGAVLPLGLDGLSLNLEGTRADTTPSAVAGVQMASTFERFSARLRYPWMRSRLFNLSSELVFDAEEETQFIDVAAVYAPLSYDRLRIFRLNTEASWITPWNAVLTGRITPSFGIAGLGSRTAAQASPALPLSRQGADAEFQKLEAIFSYTQPVVEHLTFDLRARVQTSFNQPLLRAEQIGLAYTSGLSAFDAGSVQGDSGFVVRGELQSPWSIAANGLFGSPGVGVAIAPYLFGAGGVAHLVQPTALETASVRAYAFGGGIRFGGAVSGSLTNASLTLEYGRRTRSDNVPDGNRFTLIGAMQF